MRKQFAILVVVAGIIGTATAIVLSDGGSPGARGDAVAFIQSNSGAEQPAATPAPQLGANEAYNATSDGSDIAGAPAPFPRDADTPAGGGVTTTGSGAPLVLPALDRKIIRDATLEVTVEDVPGAVQAVETAATGAGGFVSSSSITVETPPQPVPTEDEPQPTAVPDRQRATVQIRVPAERYADVVKALRGLGDVKAESSNSQEVTEEYTDLEARLRNLEATEQRYLELLNRAEAIPDILTVQDRLGAVRLEIEQVQGRMKLLDDLTDLATITVNLSLPPIAVEAPAPETEPGWAEEAWDDAWDKSQEVLETLGAVGIVAGVVLVWVLVPAVGLGIAWRVISLIGRRGGAVS